MYDEAGRLLLPLVDSPREVEGTEARWFWSIVLRNQGRVEEALRLSVVTPNPNFLAEAMLELERGNARRAIAILDKHARSDNSLLPAGSQARANAWNRTLLAMALTAAGDTAAVRRLVDSVQYWGSRSGYGRDRRSHHYLLGMLLAAEGRDAAAVEEFRQAIYSATHGFTRINYELGRALMRLNRPVEAIPIVRSALHGDIDGSNLYMTRTDLHELLAQAFDRAGMRDSAAVHYRAVVRAWERADPLYHARRDQAARWLDTHGGAPPGLRRHPTR
jgi:hypothetical protein